jgi:hypothetical protein
MHVNVPCYDIRAWNGGYCLSPHLKSLREAKVMEIIGRDVPTKKQIEILDDII